jgi:hypothetical protein
MPRRVDVGAVVVRIRVRGGLHALVAGGAAVRVDAAVAQDRQRLVQLVALRVVDQVARDDDRLGLQRVQGLHRSRQHLPAQRLLRAEGGGEGRTAAVEQLQPRRRLLVHHVRVGQLGEERDPSHHAGARRELRPVDQRLAACALQHPVAVAVAEGLLGRLARRGASAMGQHDREHRGPRGEQREKHCETLPTHADMVPEPRAPQNSPPRFCRGRLYNSVLRAVDRGDSPN